MDLAAWNFCELGYYNIAYTGQSALARMLDFGSILLLVGLAWAWMPSVYPKSSRAVDGHERRLRNRRPPRGNTGPNRIRPVRLTTAAIPTHKKCTTASPLSGRLAVVRFYFRRTATPRAPHARYPPSRNALITAAQNAGRSSGFRAVMILPSTTHSSSTHVAPAFSMS